MKKEARSPDLQSVSEIANVIEDIPVEILGEDVQPIIWKNSFIIAAEIQKHFSRPKGVSDKDIHRVLCEDLGMSDCEEVNKIIKAISQLTTKENNHV